jgi:hypothetical protein
MEIQHAAEQSATVPKHEDATQYMRKPIQPTGALKAFQHEDMTPTIGRAYYDVNIVEDLMDVPNSDDRLRELALISEQALILALWQYANDVS